MPDKLKKKIFFVGMNWFNNKIKTKIVLFLLASTRGV